MVKVVVSCVEDKEGGEDERVGEEATPEGLRVKGCGKRRRGGFEEWREGVSVWWGFVCEHVGE